VQKKTTPLVQTFNQSQTKKGNLSYLAIVTRYTTVSLKQNRKQKTKEGK